MMLKILHIELLKLNRVANYILVIVVLGLAALCTFIEVSQLKDWDKMQNPVVMEFVYRSVFGFLTTLLGVFVCLNIGREYGENTLRRITIEGYRRHQFFTGKLMIALIVSFILFLVGVGHLAIAAHTTNHVSDLKQFFTKQAIISAYVKLLYTGAFALFLAFLFRNTAAGIIIFISWGFVEAIIKVLQQFYIDRQSWHFDLYHYFPVASMDWVLGNDEVVKTVYVFIATGYLLVFLLIPYFLFETQDIK